MFIPGWLISLLTFPGVIVHEWAHKVFCDHLGVRVHKVVYFQFGNPAGYVSHEEPKTYKQTFWISVGPLLVNSMGTIALSFIATNVISGSGLWYFLLWLAISIGMHSFPSDHDMEHIQKSSKTAIQNGGMFLYYLAFPLVALVWIANKLRFFWFDAIYAITLISLSGGFSGINANSTGSNVTSDNDMVTVGEYSCTNYFAEKSDALAPLESVRTKLTSEKESLDQRDTDLTILRQKIANDDYDSTNSVEIDAHNSLVDMYNGDLKSYQIDEDILQIRIDAYNDQIEKHNDYLSEHCVLK